MTEEDSLSYSVCVQGFTAFESATFESFFQLAARRAPSYRYVMDIAQADIVVADAERPAALDAVMRAGKLARTITIGSTPVAGSAAQSSRPINMMALLRVLDELTRDMSLWAPKQVAEMPAAVAAASIDARHGRTSVARALATGPYVRPLPTTPAEIVTRATIRQAAGPMPMDRNEPADAQVLVVDDSEIALRFMKIRLNRLGFQVSLATSGDQALRMLETQHYAFVFLDVLMAGIDGFETCKCIKRKVYPDRAEPPHVIMLTSKGRLIDKMRGTISRCDGYLVKPLNELDLIKVINELDPGFMERFYCG